MHAEKKGKKKPPLRVAFFLEVERLNRFKCSASLKMFYLALSYFLRGLPPKYRRR